MGDTNPTLVKVIAAFITLLAELNDALSGAIASEGPTVAPERTEEVKAVFTPPQVAEGIEQCACGQWDEGECPNCNVDDSEEEEMTDGEWLRFQRRLDDFEDENKPFVPLETNRAIYACSGCHLSGHTMANQNRPCRRIKGAKYKSDVWAGL